MAHHNLIKRGCEMLNSSLLEMMLKIESKVKQLLKQQLYSLSLENKKLMQCEAKKMKNLKDIEEKNKVKRDLSNYRKLNKSRRNRS